jgi:hypothetical protein
MLRRQGGAPVWLLCGISKLIRKPSQTLRPFFNDTAVYFQQTGLGHGLAGAVCNQAQARTCPTWIWDGDGALHCHGLSAAESFARVSLVRCREHLYDIAFQGMQTARLRPHGCEVRFFSCDLTAAELSSLKFKCRPPCEGMGRALGVKGQFGVRCEGMGRTFRLKGLERHAV